MNNLSQYSEFSFYPEILVPIPKSALLYVKDNFQNADLTNAFKVLLEFGKRYLRSHEYIPMSSHITWNSTDIRQFEKGSRGIFKSQLIPFLFEVDNSYSAGNSSKSYRYLPEVLVSGYKLVSSNIIQEERQEFLIYNKEDVEYNENSQILKVLRKVNFKNIHLKNKDLAKGLLNKADHKGNYLLRTKFEDYTITISSYTTNKGKIKNFKRFKIYQENLQDLENLEKEMIYQRSKYEILKCSRKLRISRDKTTNRLSHNLTSIPSVTIKYLTLKDEKLKEIDMRNCHYALFANLILDFDKTFSDQLLLKAINRHNISFQRLIREARENKTRRTHAYMLSHLNNELEDVQSFMRSALNGTLYEEVGKALYGEGYSEEKRDIIKRMIMQVFYGKFDKNLSVEKLQFRMHFPNVLEIVNDLKAYMFRNFRVIESSEDGLYTCCIHSKVSKKRSDYIIGNNCLSILLMNYEAKLFVDVLLYELLGKGYEVISKHDSILVKESQYDEIKHEIECILDRELGRGMYCLK
ncbi:hypothetical protein [Portibacter marinus]|uniref:hypothetical protein n=1 Tax=Portibacter marinus TaxID=2898660 RepID=UPI001F350D6C|nr:hypothetical protein [Portibacter marinus]